MKPILIVVTILLALAGSGCRRECNCPVDCGSGVSHGGTAAVIAPKPAPNSGATAAAGATPAAATPTAATASAPAPAPEKEYCASESGEVFHRCSCTSIKRVKPGKLVHLDSRAAALVSGRRPCKHCKP